MVQQSFQLVMKAGPTPGKVISLTENEHVAGRDLSSDIVINDAEISRRHAHFSLGPNGYTLEDMGSTNGTFVNGKRLTGPYVLRPGDKILFGEHVELLYEAAVVDTDATMIGGPVQASYPPVAEPIRTYQEPPAFSGQVPPGPAESAVVPEPVQPKSKKRTWLLAGCGCLLVLCCVLVAGGYVFDSLNLYCTPPFNILFSLIVPCQ